MSLSLSGERADGNWVHKFMHTRRIVAAIEIGPTVIYGAVLNRKGAAHDLSWWTAAAGPKLGGNWP